MNPLPSTSKKRVRYTDPDYEKQLLEWLVDEDCNDVEDCDCEADFAITSNHETDSEVEGDENELTNKMEVPHDSQNDFEVEGDENEVANDMAVQSGSQNDIEVGDNENEMVNNMEVINDSQNDVEIEQVENAEAINRDILHEVENEVPPENELSRYYYGKNRFKWSTQPATSKRGRRLRENIITHLPGLRPHAAQIGPSADPLTVWKLLFSDEICDIILLWTNDRIAKQRAKYKGPSSSTLSDIDKIELYALFGLLAYTSLFKSNNENIDTLFATDGSGREIIRCIMSKERFAFLMLCLRFDNPEDRIMRQLGDASAAISEIFNIFVNNCQECYTIGASACIDEMLIGFRGRCRFKMYMPNKPVKYGVKVMCCTDARNGYFYNGYIYTGRDSDGTGLPNEDKKYGKPTQSVLRLTRPLYETNRNVTFDNWFTSIELVKLLKQRGLTCIGTIRKNKREIPPNFLPNKTRSIGTALYGFTRDITLLSFTPKKNKSVLVVSSSHHHKSEDPESKKPDIICDYNSTKGGVDSLDEKCAKFTCSRRTRRWPLVIFFRLFDISTVNAYILYSSYRDNSHLIRSKFLQKLAYQLVTPLLERRSRNNKVSRKLRLSICEILGVKENAVPETKVSKLEQRKNCSLCDYKKKRRTCYVCYNCQHPICLECARKLCPDCADFA